MSSSIPLRCDSSKPITVSSIFAGRPTHSLSLSLSLSLFGDHPLCSCSCAPAAPSHARKFFCIRGRIRGRCLPCVHELHGRSGCIEIDISYNGRLFERRLPDSRLEHRDALPRWSAVCLASPLSRASSFTLLSALSLSRLSLVSFLPSRVETLLDFARRETNREARERERERERKSELQPRVGSVGFGMSGKRGGEKVRTQRGSHEGYKREERATKRTWYTATLGRETKREAR